MAFDHLGVAPLGSPRTALTWAGGPFAAPALAQDGSAAAPSYSFLSASGDGLYYGASALGIASGGTARWNIPTATGHWLASSDNAYDIGASGASRARDFYLARNASIGGTLALTGALTYGGVVLNTAVTGTGNMVLSASPTFTGTAIAASLTLSGTLALAGATVSGTPTWSSSQAITLSTAAQPNVTSLGTLTSLTVSGGVVVGSSISSTTANATPSAFVATTYAGFASTVSGAAVMGFGTTSDVTLKSRSGSDAFRVTANTVNVEALGNMAITGTLTVTSTSQFNGNVTVGNDSGDELKVSDGTKVWSLQSAATELLFNETGVANKMGMSTAAFYPKTDGGLTLGTASLKWGAAWMGALSATTGTLSGSLQVGGGATVQKWLTATKTFDPGSMVLYDSTSTTVTVTGAAAGDLVLVADEYQADNVGYVVKGYVSAADTVTINICRVFTGTSDLGSKTFRVFVLKF